MAERDALGVVLRPKRYKKSLRYFVPDKKLLPLFVLQNIAATICTGQMSRQ